MAMRPNIACELDIALAAAAAAACGGRGEVVAAGPGRSCGGQAVHNKVGVVNVRLFVAEFITNKLQRVSRRVGRWPLQ